MSPVRKEDRLPSKQGVRGQEDKEGKAFNEIGLLYKRPEVIFHSEKKESRMKPIYQACISWPLEPL